MRETRSRLQLWTGLTDIYVALIQGVSSARDIFHPCKTIKDDSNCCRKHKHLAYRAGFLAGGETSICLFLTRQEMELVKNNGGAP